MAGTVTISKPGHAEYEVTLRRALELERYGWSVVTAAAGAPGEDPRVDVLETTVADLQTMVSTAVAASQADRTDLRQIIEPIAVELPAVAAEVDDLTATVEAASTAAAPKPTPRTDALEAWRAVAEPVIEGLGGAATLEVGTTAGTIAAGDDPRFSDAPTAHTHPAEQVTGLATVATSGSYNDLTDKPAGGGAGPLRLATDQAFTSTTLANVTGLSFAAAANTAYKFDGLLALTSAAPTTGWQFGFTGPVSPTSFVAVQEYQSSATAWTSATLQAFGGFTLVTAAYAAAPTQIVVRITGLLVNGGNAGTVQLQCRTEVASSAVTLKRGSTLLVS